MEIFLTGNLLWLREIEIKFAVKAPDSRFCGIFDDDDKNLHFFKMTSKNVRNLKKQFEKIWNFGKFASNFYLLWYYGVKL